MRKVLYTALAFMTTVGAILPPVAFAQDSTVTPTGVERRGFRGRIQNFRTDHPRARLGAGTVVTNDQSSTLTVTGADGKTYTINVGTFEDCRNQPTRIVRRFGGKASLSEIQVNDKVNVIGKFTDSNKTAVNACIVRDTTIMKRHGVIVGKVTALASNGWTMTTARDPRGPQTVVISGTPKMVDRKGNAINESEILVGHIVRVKGTWDAVSKTVSDVTDVKDYSLPPRTTVTPTPSVTQ